jgi:hypothetical protein
MLFFCSMGFKWLMTTWSYGEKWRLGRKILHGHLHSGVSPSYWPVQITSARRFTQDLLDAPAAPTTLTGMVRSSFAQSIVRMVYGIDAKADSDFISVPEKVLDALNVSMLPGRFLVDNIPLRMFPSIISLIRLLTFAVVQYLPDWFPGAGFKKYGAETQVLHRKMRDDPHEVVKSGIVCVLFLIPPRPYTNIFSRLMAPHLIRSCMR